MSGISKNENPETDFKRHLQKNMLLIYRKPDYWAAIL